MKLKYTILAVLLAFLTVVPAIKAAKQSINKDQVVFNKDNVVNINEQVSETSVADWTMKVKALDAKGPANEPIYLAMKTPGGDIVAGVNFVEAMHGIHRPVYTVTLFAASMGFQIVQNLGDRLILKNGVLMSHRASGGFEGQFGGPEPSQLSSRYIFWLRNLTQMDEQTVSRTNGKQTLDSYRKAYANEMWRNGTDSVNEGYADRVVTASCDSSLNTATHHSAQIMMFNVEYDLSDCPMVQAPINVQVSMLTNKGPMTDKEFISKAGRFDAYCMQDISIDKLCALDTSLNPQKLNQIKTDFSTNYLAKQNKVVD